MRRLVVLTLLVLVAGCGRREKPGPLDAQPPAVAAATAKPLPASAFQVRWGKLTVPPVVGADKEIPITVHFANAGDAPWPDKATANPQLKDGSYAVRLTHAWVRAAEQQDGRVGAVRTDLPKPVMPGESIDMPLTVRAPASPGEYRLVIELVQELVRWFSDAGGDRIIVPVRVVPPAEAPAGTPAAPAVQSPTVPAPR